MELRTHSETSEPSNDSVVSQKLITVFGIAKAFAGHAELIQRNAIGSWTASGPKVDVLLLGDDPGTRESAAELGVRHIEGIRVNESGTPLVSDAIRLAREHSNSEVLVYCNCDVVLTESLPAAIETLLQQNRIDQFVAIGRRGELAVEDSFDFHDKAQKESFMKLAAQNSRLGPVVCKEYFAFRRGQYQSVPDFAVGRGNWDNWMVAHAKKNGIPVVDLSEVVTAIHQDHDYGHSGSSRLKTYSLGQEARENRKLGGGSHLINGACADWRLTASGLRKCRLSGLNLPFWSDLPRFFRLLLDLLTRR